MKPVLYLFQYYVPVFIKKRYLSKIIIVAANAFNCEAPDIKKLTYRQSLKTLAEFTCIHVKKIDEQDIEYVKKQLYKGAYNIGFEIKKRLNINTPSDIISISKIMYEVININFTGNIQGDVIISKCFFSNYYDSQVCRVISYLDKGMAAGISGGGKLRFEQMITEGKKCCKANFVFGDDVT